VLGAASVPATAAFAPIHRPRPSGEPPRSRIRVAAICTSFRFREHAHVILENFLEPYLFRGQFVDPAREFEVVSMYLDQKPSDDLGQAVARAYGIPAFTTIAEALTSGGSDLAVDAVLSIGEHGTYPKNAKGQVEYPRKRLFDAITAVIEKDGRPVPVFNDKHLSYRWDWAKEMVENARLLKIPFQAGSSVPLAERRPPLELAPGCTIREAVSIHGGPIESYDFHGLEVLQSLVEGRRGGETGVASVQFLEGDALWKAAEQGRWSTRLADAAMAAELGPGQPTVRDLVLRSPFTAQPPHGILLEYADGLKAAVLAIGANGIRWNFAAQVEGEDTPSATAFHVGPWQNRCLFKALSHAIQACFRDRKSPYPLERTLLTSGALDAAMDSRVGGGKPISTPHLADVRYAPVDFRAYRENGETWKIQTDDTPEPRGVDLTARRMSGGS
jgi:hypothetical protein